MNHRVRQKSNFKPAVVEPLKTKTFKILIVIDSQGRPTTPARITLADNKPMLLSLGHSTHATHN